MKKETQKLYLGPVMTIITRHSNTCPNRGNETYHRCDCRKSLRYFQGGKQRMISTKARTLAGAERAKREKEIAFDPGLQATVAEKEKEMGLKDSVAAYLATKTNDGACSQTTSKLRTILEPFEECMAKRHKFYGSQITPDDVSAFREDRWTKWKSGVSKQKGQAYFKAFLCSYIKDAQQLKDLLDVLRPVKLTKADITRLEPRPYSEKDIADILAQIPITFSHMPEKIPILTAMIHLQVATGLAIIDVVQLERTHIEGGWLRMRRQKTGRRVRQRLHESVLKELESISTPDQRYFFWHNGSQSRSIANARQEDYRKLMKATGLYIHGNLSHRFRDTAVDFWLGEGWTLTDVADALGDTVAIVEKHYKDLASKRTEQRIAKLPVRTWKAEEN